MNQQLLEQWRKLVTANPEILSAPSPSTASDPTLNEFVTVADDVMAVFETGRGCTYLSPNWKRITGNDLKSCMRGGFYGVLCPVHQKAFITALQQAVCEEERAQLSLYPMQFLVKHKDGEKRWYHLKIANVEQTGREHRITCVLRDVHDAIEAERKVKQAHREKHLALQSRSEFLNAMSHELRTPLNAILGFTQIMETGMYGKIENPQYSEYLRFIRESGYELLAQIDEVMEMADMDAEENGNSQDSCDVYELMAQVAALHRNQARSAEVNVSIGVGTGYASLRVDRIKMQHCISHILTNAIRHCRKGGGVVMDADISGEGELCLTITDNGIGMSARKLQTVVASLQNSDWPTRRLSGNGMGLMLARELAELHGGYVTLESKSGSGTRVSVHLPAERIISMQGGDLRETA